MRLPTHHRYTWRQYLSFERSTDAKHEFFDGEIFAMAGGTPEHAALAAAVIAQLSAGLEGKPCRSYTSDLRIRVLATGLATYPDVSVVCGQPEYDPDADDTVVNPVVLVEVLSDSTEDYDRGEKFENYQRIASLQEYVLVSQREPLVEVFRRDGESWQRTEARRGKLLLHFVGATLDVDRLYAGIDLGRARS
ncbi:MAG: Uma2 family endonuclease [Myxococcaceae bacterium]